MTGQPQRRLPYPPPWQDMATLCEHICVSSTTVDNWVAQGILPPPRKRGGKLMWKWDEVDECLTRGRMGDLQDTDLEKVRHGIRRAIAKTSGHRGHVRRAGPRVHALTEMDQPAPDRVRGSD